MLIVEDSRNMRVILRQVLRSLGVRELKEASDGADAFTIMRNNPVDIIITDWEMSPLDGLEFVRMVRTAADSPNPFVSIIMLSAHTEVYRVFQARDAGVNEFLAKPVAPRSLYARIVKAIEQDRPFVRSSRYTGPCRRRNGKNFTGPERRQRLDEQLVA